MFALDTDTFTLLAHGHARVRERHDRAARGRVRIALPAVVRAEVLVGRLQALLKSADGAAALVMSELVVRTERELDKYDLLPFNERAVEFFDRLRGSKRLKKVGVADLLIACIALAHDATLVTRNTKDFIGVPNLRVENWAG